MSALAIRIDGRGSGVDPRRFDILVSVDMGVDLWAWVALAKKTRVHPRSSYDARDVQIQAGNQNYASNCLHKIKKRLRTIDSVGSLVI